MPIYNASVPNAIGNNSKPQNFENSISYETIGQNEVDNYESLWSTGIDEFPDYNHVLTDTIDKVSDDSLLIRWNHLRQETRLLISYTGQIEKEWMRQANDPNTDEPEKGSGCDLCRTGDSRQCGRSGQPQGDGIRIRHTGSRAPGRPMYTHRGAAGRKPANRERTSSRL